MSDETKVENIHTGESLTIKDTESVPNLDGYIVVYILSDGSRWDSTQFHAHWRIVARTAATP